MGENVPAIRIRRRFIVNTIVEYYKGINDGWVPAVVDAAERKTCVVDAIEDKHETAPIFTENASAWINVPINLKENNNASTEILWVPSYLLRCVELNPSG